MPEFMIAFMPYDKWTYCIDDLRIPWYCNDHEPKIGAKTHFKWHEIDGEMVMVIWYDDNPEPTAEQIKVSYDKMNEDED